MRIALCTLDGVTYQAVDFGQADGFEDKRRYLECTECGMQAYYRSYARNAREAHFGARPHAIGCALAVPEQDGTATGQRVEEDEILTTGQRIVLDFNYGTPATTQGGQPAAAPVTTGNGGTWGAGGPAARETMTRRLRPILRALMESEEFRRSTQPIEIDGQGEFTVADFFVKFADVTDDHIGSYRGFWGMVPDAGRDGRGTLWFNSGGREDLSALLDEDHLEAAYQRFHIENEDEIAGAYILVLGELRRSARNGKKYVEIDDPSCFTLRLAR